MATLVKYMDIFYDAWAEGKDAAWEQVDRLGCREAASVFGAYGGFLFWAALVAWKFSDWDFSTVLTASASMQCLAFLLLFVEVQNKKSIRGLSVRTMEIYLAVISLRLFCTLFKNGYLPVDRSGDFIYQLGDIASLVLASKLYTGMLTEHARSYDAENDTLDTRWVIAGCVGLGFCIHGNLNRSVFFDSAWTAALHMDTVALLPQLWMMRKAGGIVEAGTGNFVACMFVSKFLSWLFWYRGYAELGYGLEDGEPSADVNWAGYSILMSQTMQVIVCADYMYYYLLAMWRNRPLKLPDVDL